MESLQVQTNATIGALQEQNAHLLAERGDLTARLDAVQAENAQLDAVLQSMLTSRSWRALAPARVTAQAIRRLAR
jgi:chorismate-pyruvate lyase